MQKMQNRMPARSHSNAASTPRDGGKPQYPPRRICRQEPSQDKAAKRIRT